MCDGMREGLVDKTEGTTFKRADRGKDNAVPVKVCAMATSRGSDPRTIKGTSNAGRRTDMVELTYSTLSIHS
jgi:hypothetical protein